MRSIYLELLELNASKFVIPVYAYDEYDEYGSYEESRNTKSSDIVEAIPLKRDILIYGNDIRESANIEDLKSAITHVNIPKSKLDKYFDGDVYAEYPVAVSFLIDLHDYRQIVEADKDQDGSLQIIHFDEVVEYLFDEGIVIMAFGEGDKMRIIAGFKKESK